jgi:hypothetical protein
VLNIVHGSLHPKAPGAQARDALIAHPGVARLSFAGDAAGGQFVVLEAARCGKDLSAGLAGHAPALIFADADLDRAVDSALFGAFALNGQRRTATSTLLVERPVYDTVVGRLAQRADRIRVGAPPTRRRRSGHCRTPGSTRSSPPACGSASGKARGWPQADDGRPGCPRETTSPRRARRRDPVDAGLHRTDLRAGAARYAV